jgi:hypothetical protein
MKLNYVNKQKNVQAHKYTNDKMFTEQIICDICFICFFVFVLFVFHVSGVLQLNAEQRSRGNSTENMWGGDDAESNTTNTSTQTSARKKSLTVAVSPNDETVSMVPYTEYTPLISNRPTINIDAMGQASNTQIRSMLPSPSHNQTEPTNFSYRGLQLYAFVISVALFVMVTKQSKQLLY